MKTPKFYITTPIYYVNAKPHVGTVYSTILADVMARLERLSGKQVYFLTGTDEHGQKVLEKAEQAGVPPQQFVDSMIDAFKDAWYRYEISFDRFIRTTDPEHKQAVAIFIQKLMDSGDIYKASYSGWYCVPCETFVTSSQEVKEGCPNCHRPLKQIEEENYFFRLSVYQDQLLAFYDAHPDFITPKERFNEVRSFVQAGLKDLSITRKGLKWGIPFPGDPEHAVYVWLDALTNYISAIGYGSDRKQDQESFARWWPADMHVMAKDIVRFHAVYWPAFLMSAQLPLPKKLLVHGYVLSGQEKMSKSLGNVIDPLALAQEYGVEQIRYYLVRQMPISHDGHFALEDLESRITSDLANALGNLQSRLITLAVTNGLQTVDAPSAWEPVSVQLRNQCAQAVDDFWQEMRDGRFHTGLAAVWKFIAEVNAFFNDQKPWELAKKNKEFFAEVISATAHALHAIAAMTWPVMPRKMELLLASLGVPFGEDTNYEALLRDNTWKQTYTFTKPTEALFARVQPREHNEQPAPVASAEATSAPVKVGAAPITIDDVAKVELIVGTILACEPIEGSDKLYKLQVDMGVYGKRQIISGVRKYFAPEELVGKQGVVVANLPPRKMLGHLSEGMMLYAHDSTGVWRLSGVNGHVENGTRLS